MRPSTTDACTVLRRRALRTTSTSRRRPRRRVKSSSSWSKGRARPRSDLAGGRDGDVVGVDEDHPLAERDPGVGDLHPPSTQVREPGPPPLR